MRAVDAVLTVEEVAAKFDISARGVQKACERASDEGHAGWCRKAGGTWLIERKEAVARWQRRNLPPPGMVRGLDGDIYPAQGISERWDIKHEHDGALYDDD